jgi:small subunit ribosomal protein S5
MYWTPKTRLGKLIEKGEVTTMAEALRTRLPLREPEVVDILLPNLEDEVLDINMVQRMTDSGRRVRFAITTVVGNGDGYVGLGRARGKEVGPTIRKAIDNAKVNMIEVRRGCGSWECGCGQAHSFPFEVSGKMGSVCVTFKPAPKGISLAVGNVAKPLLKLAGVKDAWAFTSGHTKTTTNYAAAAFEALKKTSEVRVMKLQEEYMHIITGQTSETKEEEPIVAEGEEGAGEVEEIESKTAAKKQQEAEKGEKKEAAEEKKAGLKEEVREEKPSGEEKKQ